MGGRVGLEEEGNEPEEVVSECLWEVRSVCGDEASSREAL